MGKERLCISTTEAIRQGDKPYMQQPMLETVEWYLMVHLVKWCFSLMVYLYTHADTFPLARLLLANYLQITCCLFFCIVYRYDQLCAHICAQMHTQTPPTYVVSIDVHDRQSTIWSNNHQIFCRRFTIPRANIARFLRLIVILRELGTIGADKTDYFHPSQAHTVPIIVFSLCRKNGGFLCASAHLWSCTFGPTTSLRAPVAFVESCIYFDKRI
jgi:hypothetical protein